MAALFQVAYASYPVLCMVLRSIGGALNRAICVSFCDIYRRGRGFSPQNLVGMSVLIAYALGRR